MGKPVESPAPSNPARRRLFQAAGAAGAAIALPAGAQPAGGVAVAQPVGAAAARPVAEAKAYVFFNPAEAAFIEAAVARLIPRDENGPGALEAGVPDYIDRQLAGAWGAG